MSTKRTPQVDEQDEQNEQSKGSDLSALDILTAGDEPQRMEVIDPRTKRPFVASNGRVAALHVLSTNSQSAQDYLDRQAAKDRKRRVELTPEEFRERNLKYLAMLVTATPWENIFWKGEELPCNAVNAVLVLRHAASIRDQVSAFANEESNYLGN